MNEDLNYDYIKFWIFLFVFIVLFILAFLKRNRKRKIVLIVTAIICLLIGLVFGFFSLFYSSNSDLIRYILNKKNLPSSVKNKKCEDWGFSDVLVTCYFEIDSTDFQQIINGRDYKKDTTSKMSYDITSGPKIGENFEVEEKYSFYFNGLRSGSRVIVGTDKSRQKIIADIYIE